MITVWTILGFYLIIGFCIGLILRIIVVRKPHLFESLSSTEIMLFNHTILFFVGTTLIGVPLFIYQVVVLIQTWVRTKELLVQLNGRDFIVFAERENGGCYLADTISFDDELDETLDALEPEELSESIEEIRQQLNAKYRFNREVLYLHLADVE